ncbi:hypothetical protein [Microbacterium sp.]|uniref:hypothetical protein n=1 Tax=Microbacterium sp. TaxID=51671 RepID=UPI0039E3D831
MTENQRSTGDAPEDAPENLLSARSMARDAVADIGGGILDELMGWLYTAGLYLGILFALVCPVGGIIVGGLLIWRAVVTERSKFVPICILVMAVIFWVLMKSPFGLLPLLFEML